MNQQHIKFNLPFIHIICGTIALLSLSPIKIYAGASADSWGSDWFGTGSGWVDDGHIKTAPGGKVIGEYKHWFESPAPLEYTREGAAMWTLPDKITDFPVIVSLASETITTSTTDGHGCLASSDWKWKAYRTIGNVILKKYTRAYANAKSIKGTTTEAHSRTRFADPWEFTNQQSDDEWNIFGRIALQGEMYVDKASNESAFAFIEMNYSISENGNTPLDILNLFIGTDGDNQYLSLNYDPKLNFFRNGNPISASQIIDELRSYYSATNRDWILTIPTGTELDEGYYFDISYNLSSSINSAILYSSPRSGADDTLTDVPEPTTLSLLFIGLSVFILLRIIKLQNIKE